MSTVLPESVLPEPESVEPLSVLVSAEQPARPSIAAADRATNFEAFFIRVLSFHISLGRQNPLRVLSRYSRILNCKALETFVVSDHTEGMLSESERYAKMLQEFFDSALN